MSGAFEAKLHSYRRTQDGAVVAFVIQPHDVTAELAMASLGTRFMIGFSEIGDDETPIAPRAARLIPEDSATTEPPRETSKRRTPFAELPLSQQAGLLSKDKAFHEFLALREGRMVWMWEARDFIRDFCGITSRAQLDDAGRHSDAIQRWKTLYDEFAAWKLTQAYAETIR